MDKLDLIYDVAKNTAQKLDKLEEISSKNSSNLEEHMRRTEASEKRIRHIEEKLTLGYILKIVISATCMFAGFIKAIEELVG